MSLSQPMKQSPAPASALCSPTKRGDGQGRRSMVFVRSCLLLACVAAQVAAQGKPAASPKATVLPETGTKISDAALGEILERELARFVKRKKPIGVAIGVVRGKASATRFAGVTDKKAKRAVDIDTLFEIGSITKVFNGILLADMERRGKLRSSAALAEFLPKGTRVPELDGGTIRLVDLVTHRSGLPRMPSNIKPKDRLDPYADYGDKQLIAYLRLARLKRKPDTTYVYSNLGAALLGFVIARRAEKDWEELCCERICQPLGLASTRHKLDDKLGKRFARAHFPNGLAGKAWNFDAFVAAGGLRSSLRDMMRFASCCAGITKTDLAASLAHSQRVLAKGAGHTRMAYGWHVRKLTDKGKSYDVFQHGGRTGGFSTSIAVIPAKQCAVVALMNQSMGLDGMPSRVLSAAVKLGD